MSRQVWAAQDVVRVGEYHIGVRASTREIHEFVVAALSDHLVDDTGVRASYAIMATSSDLPGARPVFKVFHDCDNIFTTPRLDRAVAFLTGRLETHLPQPQPAGVLDLDASALVGDDHAVIAPGSLLYKLPDFEMRVRRYGLRVLEFERVLVEAETASIIVPPRRLRLTGPLHPRDGSCRESVLVAGHRTVDRCVFLKSSRAGPEVTRARAVARGLLLANRQPAVEALGLLAALMPQVRVTSVPRMEQLLSAVRET